MNRPLPSRDFNQPAATPAERIKAARRELDWHYWFLKRHLASLAKQVKEAEKTPVAKRGRWPASSLEQIIEETKGLAIQRGAAIFRELGNVRRAVADHQADALDAER